MTVSQGKAAVLLDFVQITSPPSRQFEQLVQLFSDAKIQNLIDNLELKLPRFQIFYGLPWFLVSFSRFEVGVNLSRAPEGEAQSETLVTPQKVTACFVS